MKRRTLQNFRAFAERSRDLTRYPAWTARGTAQRAGARRRHWAAAVGLGLALAQPVAAATYTTYTSRPAFLAPLQMVVTDDYSAPGYGAGDVTDTWYIDIFSDAAMSAVLGETDYTATGWPNQNTIYQIGDPNYCAGCNGSFRLTFTSTSVGTPQGVIGAGFDNLIPGTDLYAFVTFGDSTTADIPLNGLAFFGIISPSLIRSIHVGLAGGGATQSGVITIDNLSIGGTDCSIAPDGTPCNDGIFCNGEDSCGGGTCSVHGGNPCASECNQTCNEVSASCFDPAGTACSDEGNPCTTDTCNGSGACVHAAGNAGTECRAAVDDCDVAETCTGLSSTCPADLKAPNGTPCTDGTVCTQVDQCSGGTCVGGSPLDCDDGDACTQDSCHPVSGCINDIAPTSGCRSAQKSLLLVRQSDDDTKDKLIWKWIKGEATTRTELADPTSTADYTLCVYVGTANVLLESVEIPVDGTKWQPLGDKGYKYTDGAGAADGVTKGLVKGGDAGKSKALVKGKGMELPDPALGTAVALPVTAQLVNEGTGVCLEGIYDSSDVIKNGSSRFKAKAQ